MPLSTAPARTSGPIRVCAAVAGAAACLVLTACTDDPVPGATQEEVSAWLASHDGPPADVDPDAVLGAGSGGISPQDPAEQPADAGVTVSFVQPVRVERVHLACLGDGTLDFTVHVMTDEDGASSERSVEFPDVPCGPDETSAPLAVPDAVGVRMTPGVADRTGAWSATVLGG
ncbi:MULTISPECIES: hypothetical protein [unclassified Cellulomonas]|uniref:hypothetical protein n=1 Tax=unclassified Cellulomonas TaxID=2620175 RepID=UPI0024B644CC|nr:hypothetical protein [Cellulomonas sp. ES6]WHP16892.1 hypothetical protein P9841_14940 [Cellulomonas sp. ES6]